MTAVAFMTDSDDALDMINRAEIFSSLRLLHYRINAKTCQAYDTLMKRHSVKYLLDFNSQA